MTPRINIRHIIYCFVTLILLFSCQKEDFSRVPEFSVSDSFIFEGNSAFSIAEIIDQGNGISEFGICWSTTTSPTIDQNFYNYGRVDSLGLFEIKINPLEPNTKYFCRLYGRSGGILYYGSEQIFTTPAKLVPVVSTGNLIENNMNSVIFQGEIQNIGFGWDSLIDVGHCWSRNNNPTISDSHIGQGPAARATLFESKLEDLAGFSIYYIRAYAIYLNGIIYGETKEFETRKSAPKTRLNFLTWQGDNSPGFSVEIVETGNGRYPNKIWLCYGQTENPTINDQIQKNNSGLINQQLLFTIASYKIEKGKTYYFRAYAENDVAGSYSNSISLQME